MSFFPIVHLLECVKTHPWDHHRSFLSFCKEMNIHYHIVKKRSLLIQAYPRTDQILWNSSLAFIGKKNVSIKSNCRLKTMIRVIIKSIPLRKLQDGCEVSHTNTFFPSFFLPLCSGSNCDPLILSFHCQRKMSRLETTSSHITLEPHFPLTYSFKSPLLGLSRASWMSEI